MVYLPPSCGWAARKLGEDTFNAVLLPSADADPWCCDRAGLLVRLGHRTAGAAGCAPTLSRAADAAARLRAGDGCGLLVRVDRQRARAGAAGAAAGHQRA